MQGQEVLGRMSPLPLWSRRLWTQARLKSNVNRNLIASRTHHSYQVTWISDQWYFQLLCVRTRTRTHTTKQYLCCFAGAHVDYRFTCRFIYLCLTTERQIKVKRK